MFSFSLAPDKIVFGPARPSFASATSSPRPQLEAWGDPGHNETAASDARATPGSETRGGGRRQSRVTPRFNCPAQTLVSRHVASAPRSECGAPFRERDVNAHRSPAAIKGRRRTALLFLGLLLLCPQRTPHAAAHKMVGNWRRTGGAAANGFGPRTLLQAETEALQEKEYPVPPEMRVGKRLSISVRGIH